VSNDRIKELGELYLQRTRNELLLLNNELQAARSGSAESLLAMQHISHRIAGSGAMLGFKTISEAAAQIERILRRADPVPTDAEWNVVAGQISLIQTELDGQPTGADVDL
jgi:HPt (histidine-containing phosphotransfer) domain-containing protein